MLKISIGDDDYSKEGGLLHPGDFRFFILLLCKGSMPHTTPRMVMNVKEKHLSVRMVTVHTVMSQ